MFGGYFSNEKSSKTFSTIFLNSILQYQLYFVPFQDSKALHVLQALLSLSPHLGFLRFWKTITATETQAWLPAAPGLILQLHIHNQFTEELTTLW